MTDTPSHEDRDNPTTTPEPDTPAVTPNGDPSTEEAVAEAAVAADAPALDEARAVEEVPTVETPAVEAPVADGPVTGAAEDTGTAVSGTGDEPSAAPAAAEAPEPP